MDGDKRPAYACVNWELIENHIEYVNGKYGYNIEVSYLPSLIVINYEFDIRHFRTSIEAHAFLNGINYCHDFKYYKENPEELEKVKIRKDKKACKENCE